MCEGEKRLSRLLFLLLLLLLLLLWYTFLILHVPLYHILGMVMVCDGLLIVMVREYVQLHVVGDAFSFSSHTRILDLSLFSSFELPRFFFF